MREFDLEGDTLSYFIKGAILIYIIYRVIHQSFLSLYNSFILSQIEKLFKYNLYDILLSICVPDALYTGCSV